MSTDFTTAMVANTFDAEKAGIPSHASAEFLSALNEECSPPRTSDLTSSTPEPTSSADRPSARTIYEDPTR
jgi:hypothetical protein